MHLHRLTLSASLLALLSYADAKAAPKDAHVKSCHPIEEYYSNFSESCDKCANICDPATHNYNAETCAELCAEFKNYAPLKAEIHSIQMQQNVIVILLLVLLALIAIRYACKCVRWLRHNRCCLTDVLKKLRLKKQPAAQTYSGKDLGSTTISNVMAINDIERAPSQIYSVTGAEGSVMTMTTPVSTRYPAENSTTPTTTNGEYSYDNQALAVTPVSEKPNNAQNF